ncbi:MAG: tetratricopeptide repeat protein, partial [Candidatus Methylopumilus sp.]
MKALKQSEINELIELHQSGQFALAEEKAKNLINDFPKELILLNVLGVSQEAQKKFKEAADSYHHALKIQPQFAEMEFNLGSVLFQLGDSQAAIQHYQKAIQIKPNLVVAYFNLGIAYQNESEFDKALSAYQKAIELEPGFYEAYGNKGAVYLLQGDFDAAILSFQKSLNIQDHARGHFNLGNAYRNQGHLEKAIQSYQRAIEMSPNDAEICSVLGDALWHQGKIQEANQYLR